MGLKSLIKKPAPAEASAVDNEAAADAFISGAPVSTSKSAKRAKRKPTHTYVRTTFSLSSNVNKQIDKISLVPRAFRINRSDVVRAGVMALMAMDRAELLSYLERVSQDEPITDLMEDDGETSE